MLISAPGLISGIRLGKNAAMTNANCNVSTVQSKFGSSSLRNSATGGSYANITPTTNFAFGTGDFTIEFWYYPNVVNTQQSALGFRPGATAGAYIVIALNVSVVGTAVFYTQNATRITTAANSLVANTWNNISLVRSSGNTKFYVNGTQSGNTYVDTNSYLAPRFILAADDYGTPGGAPLNGYLDELRISNVARYTGNYTVATEPFIDDNNTLLLYHFDQANGSQNLVDDNS